MFKFDTKKEKAADFEIHEMHSAYHPGMVNVFYPSDIKDIKPRFFDSVAEAEDFVLSEEVNIEMYRKYYQESGMSYHEYEDMLREENEID